MVRIRDSFKYGVFAAALAFGATGCDDEEPMGVTPPTKASVPVTAQTTTAVAGKKFTFAGGVAALGTTGSTDVTFTSSSAATVVAGGKTSMAMVRYGSCIFTFPACAMPKVEPCDSHTVNPCVLNVDASGAGTGSFQLGNATSASVSIGMAAITCSGTSCTVTVNGMSVGNIPLPTGSMGG